MPNKKLTDSEIVKALKCCMKICKDCDNCPCINNNDYINVYDCKYALLKDALDLITRQQAEIESLKADFKRACAERDMRICINNFTESAAIADFAERLRRNAVGLKLANRDYRFVSVKEIDSLVIKMSGETHEW